MPLRPTRRTTRPALLAAAAALVVAGCQPYGGKAAKADPSITASQVGNTAGGTLTALALGPVTAWDPQRIGSRADMAFATRTITRTLTAYQPSGTVGQQSRLVGDLATDIGHPSADRKTWSFTLRAGVAWQDGSPVTCEDVKYGVSRTFATKDILGGPAYALVMLDIPKAPDGTSVYAGPYATGPTAKVGATAYDKAVSCDGRTITFHLAAPTADFGEVVTLPAFAPYPKARDRGKDSTYAVWSTGPYELQGDWNPDTGGTFVRNPGWSRASDQLRSAYPDTIVYQEGVETQSVFQRIMADGNDGRAAISLESAPPAMQQQIEASAQLRGRSINPGTGLVDYLAPNLKSATMAKPDVRTALALATNRDAYVTALGGATAALPAFSVIPRGLTAHRDVDALVGSPAGDPAAAATLLTKAGMKLPVPITVTYRSTDTSDKALAALAAGWTKGGFAVTLKPVQADYFTQIADPSIAAGTDVFWSNWAPEWASASTILPPLFDSRLNLTAAGTGRDYGAVADANVNARMTELASVGDRADREAGWAALDRTLAGQGYYIALAQRRAMYLAGSEVRNFSADEAVGGYVDLAGIGVR
ncbi:MAG: ABC transporter substrate-binding protein [Nostocoides sp.]